MTINNLERVLWRLRKKKPISDKFSNMELRRAIMYECGTDPRTVWANRKALKDLGWIKARGSKYIKLTNADVTGDEL